MLKKYYNFISISLAIFFVFGASFSSAKSSVWQATKHGKTIYLAGSIHILRASDYPLPKEFSTALSRSHTIYIEADTKSMEQPLNIQKMMQIIMSQDGMLASKLSDKTSALLNDYCLKEKLPCNNLQPFKHGWASVMLSVMAMQKLGFNAEQGIENYVLQYSVEQHKPLKFLESMEDQLHFINSLDSIDSNILFIQTIQELKQLPTLINAMVKAWRQGDTQKLGEIGLSSFYTNYPQVYNTLIVKRNNNWLRKISAIMQEDKPAILIVGALHLVGKDGLLAKLRAQGYDVKYVKTPLVKKLNSQLAI